MITPWRGRLRYQPGEFLLAGHTTAVERAGQLGLVAGAVSIAPAGFTSDSNHAGTRRQGSHCNRALRAPVRQTEASCVRPPGLPPRHGAPEPLLEPRRAETRIRPRRDPAAAHHRPVVSGLR